MDERTVQRTEDIADMSGKKNRFRLEHWQVVALYLLVYDILVVYLAYFLALWIRFDCRFNQIPGGYLAAYLKFIPFYMVFCVLVFWRLRLYQSIWRFASFSELNRVILASVITTVFHIVGITLTVWSMPGE